MILIVEDSTDLQLILKMTVESEGHTTVLASNGKEALDFLKKGKEPSLILLDLMMPVMDGWEFLKEREKDPELVKIPVVVCSAADRESVSDLRFLKKPVDLTDLVGVLRQTAFSA